MLEVGFPESYPREREYILSVLLNEFLGLEYSMKSENRRDWRISMGGNSSLRIADGLFKTSLDAWLTPASLPKRPLKTWSSSIDSAEPTLVARDVPVIYGEDPLDPAFFAASEEGISLGLDIFGSCFFMLTRYEELVTPDRDSRDRFPATASIAYQEKFLDRPVVNEYLEILWACLRRLWPFLERRERRFTILPSHDVDLPFEHAFAGPLRLIRACGGDVIKRRQFGRPLKRVKSWFAVKAGDPTADPCNTFDFIMNQSERRGLRSAFNFIASHTAGAIDGSYQLKHPWILELLRDSYRRGHEIGLHTSYNTYLDATQTRREFEILRAVCDAEGVLQSDWGGRQHYLRWSPVATLQNWNDADLDYDSTLAFADVAGFRCGVCYEFRTFNLVTRKALRLRERPLIVMDQTVMAAQYMGLGSGEAAHREIVKYKNRCRLFNGDFTLLWHNSSLVCPEERALYEEVLCA